MKKIRRIYAAALLLALVACSAPEQVDVLVVGGGASGTAAGIQSARMGVSTMILEETPWLGGMLTSAGVSCVDGNNRLRSGIFGEFADSLVSRYGSNEALQSGWVSNINFDPHIGQEILSNMADACGALLDVRRESVVADVRGEAGNWTVTFVDSRGRKKVNADILIDATELGDIAKACGVDYRIGMEASSQTGESIAPEHSNDVIQDLTFVAFLKDYGPDADMTIDKPEGYDPMVFANAARNPLSDETAETGQTIWSPQMMITYGKTPQGRYMINWPIYGNDYYVNIIEMSRDEREKALEKAKNFTLCFIYFIQTQLGMKNLGLADDVFPTEDRLPFIPYHRESRRIVGEAFFTLDAAADPYGYAKPYYRTGIAVGDYPVDHHHFRHPRWRELPDLEFYPVPSFNVPMGTIIPKNIDDLIVAEKSISVSNLMNGSTRLQPVVMQLGQASGALAALAVLEGKSVKKIGVRQLQEELLEAGCYIMPYLDLKPEDRHFKAVQRIGATGILRGEGRNVGWSNETWFRCGDPLRGEDIFLDSLLPGFKMPPGEISIGRMMQMIRGLGGAIPSGNEEQWWDKLGLLGYDPDRTVLRMEAAVVVDAAFDPFGLFEVNYDGNFLK